MNNKDLFDLIWYNIPLSLSLSSKVPPPPSFSLTGPSCYCCIHIQYFSESLELTFSPLILQNKTQRELRERESSERERERVGERKSSYVE